jgi:4-alpha-glucanotransferase
MDREPSGDRHLRSGGLLLHVTSLPGGHGIGDLGPAAFAWVDWLADAGQSWWQMLPLGPTGYGDSPYQCLSAFAGNPSLISLDRLVAEGLLERGDLPTVSFPADHVDYGAASAVKSAALERGWHRFQQGAADDLRGPFNSFCHSEAEWLDPFALYLSLKQEHGQRAWTEWPAEHRRYDRDQLRDVIDHFHDRIGLHKFRQFLFFRQWQALRSYARRRGVRFIGDMPIFVAGDSSEVWSRPDLFQLHADGQPTAVAGVPPDYFSKTGQLWGNPLYEWQRHEHEGYAWWIARLRATLKLVDLVRLDHFRGFEAYWSVPAGSETAEPGRWIPGPGASLFVALESALGGLPLIAEDLGVITPPVDALRQRFGLPGMRVLQFAFGGAQEDRFLPHHYEPHTVVYTGTHDNDTTRGWYEQLTPEERRAMAKYAPALFDDNATWEMIRLAWASVADLAVAPLQDVLDLGTEARMNFPGTLGGNWKWRFRAEQLTAAAGQQLRELTDVYQRAGSKSH